MIPIFEWLFPVAVITCIIGLIQYKWNRRRLEKLAEQFPGPPCLPILGNLFYFLNVTHEDYIYKVSEMVQKYSNERPMRFWLGNHLVIAIFHPKEVEAVLCHPKVIDKNLLFEYFKSRSLGAFTLSGENWRKHRRFANKMFHKNLMEWYVTVFNEQGHELEEYFKKKNPKETFDVSRPIMRCTLDTICMTVIVTQVQQKIVVILAIDEKNGTATGVHMNLQKNADLTFPDDLTISSEIIIERIYKPWLRYDSVFKITALGKEMFERISRIHAFTLSVITRRRDDLKSQNNTLPPKSNGFYKGNGSIKRDDKLYIDQMFDYAESEKLSDQDIVLAALDIIIGGADTSAIADSYILVFLGMYQEWQEKIHKELDEVLGASEKDITLHDIDQLTNLEMVIKEILRLYTAPHTVRDINEDIALDDYIFPAGSVVYILTFLLHRDPTYWSHPNSFHPEHFLPENVASRPKYSYAPFSYGLRSCPGSKYGMISMKILLARILRKFRVECDLKMENMKHKPSLMLELIGGYPIRIIPRTKFYYN